MERRAVCIVNPPYRQVADTLRQEHGWDTCGFSAGIVSEELKDGYSEFLDLYEVVERAKTAPVPGDIIQRCQRLEQEYGLNLADIISADRHLGIGWLTGGLYPRGKLSEMGYEKHLHIMCQVFESFAEYLRRVQPDLVCPGAVGSFYGAIAYAVSDRGQIPTYALARVAYDSYYWQRDRFGTVPHLDEVYRRVKTGNGNLDHHYLTDIAAYNAGVVPAMRASGGFPGFMRRLLRIVAVRARMKTLGTSKLREASLPSMIRHYVRNYLNYRKEMRRSYASLDELATSSYVYFPLHIEPEASLLGLEPHFTNQAYAVELLSKSVPAGVEVVVKEHWNAVGNRPAHWMDAIAEFPRVKLVHPFDDSIAVIRGAMAVATISGSSGMEAAILGKPVISMGPNYRFNFVDHVYFADNLLRLRELITWIFENKDSTDFASNGAALKEAIEMTTFKAGDALFSRQPSQSSVEMACTELLKLYDGNLLGAAPTGRGATVSE